MCSKTVRYTKSETNNIIKKSLKQNNKTVEREKSEIQSSQSMKAVCCEKVGLSTLNTIFTASYFKLIRVRNSVCYFSIVHLGLRHMSEVQHDLWMTDELLPAGSAAGSSDGIVFTHGPILGFFRPAGATRCTDQGHIWQIYVDWGCA